MKLPTSQKIMREDLRDAPNWITGIIIPVNQFMENVYQALNGNIDDINIRAFSRESEIKTDASGEFEPIKFQNQLKVRVSSCIIMQVLEKGTRKPLTSSNPAWDESNGVITIHDIAGLPALTTVIVRFRMS